MPQSRWGTPTTPPALKVSPPLGSAVGKALRMFSRVLYLLASLTQIANSNSLDRGALAGYRYRVIVSTDIGGTDADDFQSMVHLLLYSDLLDLEGLVSSPYGPGRKADILRVIECYERDYPKLRTHSPLYPTPAQLRAITKQGAIDRAGPTGVGRPTEGSEWIIRCARRPDPRPLYVLVWGGLEDLAQALHDAPDIRPKLRVYFIGGPNKMWSADAYDYIQQNHPQLWMIECNSTYRGWFVGGNQTGDLDNRQFVNTHVAGRGALGSFFAMQLGGVLKMGDSPSVGFLLRGNPEDPSQPGWGGKFQRVWDGRKTVFHRLTSERDQVEVFGIVEFALPLPPGMTRKHWARVLFDHRVPVEALNDGRFLRFRFSPRDPKVWTYEIQSNFTGLNGTKGSFTAVFPPLERTQRPSGVHPNWWTDDQTPEAAESIHRGARHVNRWREEFLRDFAERLKRCLRPTSSATTEAN